jgi:pimeloyl-ACP methyl ester carboxylesterase
MLQREFEDIAAVVDSIDTAVNLIGHSFGGLGVLEAALLTPNVRRLIAYEPGPVPTPPNEIERLQKRLDDGDREGMITTFLSEVVQMPAYELDLLKASPVFPAMVMAAPTVPRELRAEQMYQFEPERFQQLTIPTLLLVGGDSPHVSKATVETWHTCLPNSHLVELLGQQHIAHYTAPDLFAREVVMFLADSAL